MSMIPDSVMPHVRRFGISEVMEAVETVEANRDRVILDLPPDRVISETLTRASFEARRFRYGKGYAIPAPGSCALSMIEAEGLS